MSRLLLCCAGLPLLALALGTMSEEGAVRAAAPANVQGSFKSPTARTQPPATKKTVASKKKAGAKGKHKHHHGKKGALAKHYGKNGAMAKHHKHKHNKVAQKKHHHKKKHHHHKHRRASAGSSGALTQTVSAVQHDSLALNNDMNRLRRLLR